MKTKIYAITIMSAALMYAYKSNAQTNRSLSNLTSPTAINQSLLPDVNNTKDIGSNATAWKNIYISNSLFLNKKLALYSPGSGNFFMDQMQAKLL